MAATAAGSAPAPEPSRAPVLGTTRGWDGAVPEGVALLRMATPYCWILMRVFTEGGSDLAVAHALQDAVTIEKTGSRRRGRRRPGPFYLVVRSYLPERELIDGEWVPEAVQRTAD